MVCACARTLLLFYNMLATLMSFLEDRINTREFTRVIKTNNRTEMSCSDGQEDVEKEETIKWQRINQEKQKSKEKQTVIECSLQTAHSDWFKICFEEMWMHTSKKSIQEKRNETCKQWARQGMFTPNIENKWPHLQIPEHAPRSRTHTGFVKRALQAESGRRKKAVFTPLERECLNSRT